MIEFLKVAAGTDYVAKQFRTDIDWGVCLLENCGDHQRIVMVDVVKDQLDADHLLAIVMDEWELY